MASIQDEWNDAVDSCSMMNPVIPVIGNVHAKPMTTADELRDDIKAQMDSRVRWTESVQVMLKSDTQAFVEVGSGSVLLGLIRRIESGVIGYPLGSPTDFVSLVS